MSLIMPAVAMAALILFVYLMITVLGVSAKMSGALSDDYSRNKSGTPPPDWLANWGRNFTNQFELPVLFFALVALQAAMPDTIDHLQPTLAWVFVGTRYLHTFIHVTINHVGLRFLAHRAGFVVLAIMWVHFAFAVMHASSAG